MYLRAIDELAACGYEHYEISNFARPGLASRHNLKYWTDQEWLAFGCGAHSTMDGVRWKNVSATDTYVEASTIRLNPDPAGTWNPPSGGLKRPSGGLKRHRIAEVRELGSLQQFQEAVFMGLRLVAGIDVDAFAGRYGIDVWARYGPRLERFVEAGLLVRDGGRLRLTPRGLLLSNEIMSVFVDGDDRVR
jgi:oxygen-independent coproporphyrinogen-3 oxidase